MANNKIDQPNFTQIPNVLLEQSGTMEETELRIILAISRKTFGWHKREDLLSLSQFKILTGMSRPSIVKGIGLAIANGWIARRPYGNSFKYTLLVNDVYQPGEMLVNVVYQSGGEMVNDVYTQKKEVLKEKTLRAKTARARSPIFDAIASVCGPLSEPEHTDWVKENGGWIAKIAVNGAAKYPPEKIAEWFGPGGWWYAVRCAGMQDTPRPTPESIKKTVALAAAWSRIGNPESQSVAVEEYS